MENQGSRKTDDRLRVRPQKTRTLIPHNSSMVHFHPASPLPRWPGDHDKPP